MNLGLYGFGPRGQAHWLMVDCGVTFGGAGLRRASIVMVPDTALHRGRAREPRRHRPDPRARGPLSARCSTCGRGSRSRSPRRPFTAALLEAKRVERAGGAADPVTIVSAGRALHLRPVRRRVHHRHPFDPRGEGARHPHAARHGAPHRRLEARPDAACSARHRRGALPRDRRRGRAGAGLRLDQRHARGRAARARPRWRRARRDHRSDARAGVAVTTFASNVGRIASIARRRRRRDARSWWSAAPWSACIDVARELGYLDGVPPFSSEEAYGYLPRDKVVLICHRQPGRAARRAGPHRARRPSATIALSPATR